MMDAVRTSETSVYFNEAIWRNIPEGCHLQIESVISTNVSNFPSPMICSNKMLPIEVFISISQALFDIRLVTLS
jgi:hypothetical protein